MDIPDRRFADMRPFLELLRELDFSPRSIVDVGANRGQWTELAHAVFPAAEFLLIEPQPEMRESLDALSARLPGVRWIEVAAGAQEGVRLQTIWEDLQGSSFLPLPDPALRASGRQRPALVRRLDDILGELGTTTPDLVKLDVQGFELEVLKGCPALFDSTELFILETSLYSFLPELPILREVVSFMADRGYEIYDIPGYIYRPIDGALAQLDIAFSRRRGRLRAHDRW